VPSLPIHRGLAGPGLLAHVLVAKYCDHLPLYRQAEIYARSGLDLDRSTPAFAGAGSWPIGLARVRGCCARWSMRWART
jgi:transposase